MHFLICALASASLLALTPDHAPQLRSPGCPPDPTNPPFPTPATPGCGSLQTKPLPCNCLKYPGGI